MSLGLSDLKLVNRNMLQNSNRSINAWVGEDLNIGDSSARIRTIDL
jgi:hypothetical protein